MGGWVHALCIGVQSPAASTPSGAADSPAPIAPLDCPVIGRHEYCHLVKLKQIIRFHRGGTSFASYLDIRLKRSLERSAFPILHSPSLFKKSITKSGPPPPPKTTLLFGKVERRGARAVAAQRRRGKCFLAN